MSSPVATLGDVRTVALSEIHPYERNPRRIPARAVEQVAKSIRDFGWQQPLVVDTEGVLVIGHVRLAAAKSLGLPEAPVVTASGLSEAQVRALRIADNRAHDYTTWDYQTLVEELNGMGEEFADVLDLTDWSNLMKEFETHASPGGAQSLPSEPDVVMPGTGYTLSVEFADRNAADAAGPTLMALDGVLNVRHATR